MKRRWSDEQIKALKELANSGYLASQITMFDPFKGFTRNQIIGACNRNGFKLHYHMKYGTKPTCEAVKPAPIRTLVKIPPPVPAPVIKPKKQLADPANRKPMNLIKEGECRYPMGSFTPKETTFLCGLPVQRGSYCLDHANLCYQSHEETRKVSCPRS